MMSPLDLRSRLRGALLGACSGDALALGVHWIYNPSKIARLHGRIENFLDPSSSSYHGTRQTGDFSHYGDQLMELLRSLQPGADFSLESFARRWRTMWQDDPGYIDGASKGTLANLEAGQPPHEAASDSNDLAGAARIAPLLVALADRSEDELAEAARSQTAFTHGDPGVAEAAAYFARVSRKLLEGLTLDEALDGAVSAETWEHIDPAAHLADARRDREAEPVAALQERGLTCHLPDTFPSVLFLLVRYPDSLEEALIENTMAGGDSAARGLLVGLVLGAALGESAVPSRWIEGLRARDELLAWFDRHQPAPPSGGSNRIEFVNDQGVTLAARLEWPRDGSSPPRAIAIFAHCFTCSKDLPATSRISRALADRGIAVLRFDFTGLGSSDGDFANTNFSSNVEDLVAASRHLEGTVGKPTLLIGHSLGGAAVVAATRHLPGVRGVVTIGAPSDPSHVSHLFHENLDRIEAHGEAEVDLAGRTFTIRKHFLEDIREQNVLVDLSRYRGSLLILHAPQDEVVSLDHAGHLYSAAKHPKSFVALAGADHLLTRPAEARFAAEMIAAWSGHLVEEPVSPS